MTCVTCIAWRLKDSPLARHGFASCAHAPRWESLPYGTPACLKHNPLNAEKIKARLDWLAGNTRRDLLQWARRVIANPPNSVELKKARLVMSIEKNEVK